MENLLKELAIVVLYTGLGPAYGGVKAWINHKLKGDEIWVTRKQ